jgi:hypothetical protein
VAGLLIKGKTMKQVIKQTPEELFERWLSDNEERFHCAQLSERELLLAAFVRGYEEGEAKDE